MKNKKLLCSVCFLFTFMSVLWGQNITVKGNVTSKTDGQPIIGASVVQNDSKSTGTITDLDGNFTLSVPTNALLAISGSSSNLVVNSLSLYFQVNNYPFLLTFIRKYRH